MTNTEKNIAIAEMLQPSYIGYLKENLKFNSDANWQMEAIDWIEKQNTYIRIEKSIGKLSSWFVNFDSKHGEIKEVQVFSKDRKKAIFEALYQFSQYLKQQDGKK